MRKKFFTSPLWCVIIYMGISKNPFWEKQLCTASAATPSGVFLTSVAPICFFFNKRYQYLFQSLCPSVLTSCSVFSRTFPKDQNRTIHIHLRFTIMPKHNHLWSHYIFFFFWTHIIMSLLLCFFVFCHFNMRRQSVQYQKNSAHSIYFVIGSSTLFCSHFRNSCTTSGSIYRYVPCFNYIRALFIFIYLLSHSIN